MSRVIPICNSDCNASVVNGQHEPSGSKRIYFVLFNSVLVLFILIKNALCKEYPLSIASRGVRTVLKKLQQQDATLTLFRNL